MTTDKHVEKRLVTICTYNERENISTLIPAIREFLPGADILVVDDNSPDGTADVVRQFRSHDSQVDLLLRMQKSGLGAATLAGFQEGLRRGYDILINMDADWSHPPAILPKLVAAIADADVAVASRYISGGGITGWPWQRYLMSWGVNWYSRMLLGIHARDCSGAYRAYRAAYLNKIDFAHFRARGYAVQEELLFHCQQMGCRIREVPFVFEDRTVGVSKINLREIARALTDIAVLGSQRLFSHTSKVSRQQPTTKPVP